MNIHYPIVESTFLDRITVSPFIEYYGQDEKNARIVLRVFLDGVVCGEIHPVSGFPATLVEKIAYGTIKLDGLADLFARNME